MNGRDRRALTIGAGVIAAMVLIGRGAPVLVRWERDVETRTELKQAELSRAKEAIARAGHVRDSARARGSRIVALAPALVEGDSPATGSATLAGIISGAAARANVKVGALQLHADTSSRGTFVRIGVRSEATGDIAGVTAMLASLEGAPTLLAVRELSITQSEPSAPLDRVEALHVEMLVEGLMLRPHPKGVR